MTETAGAKVLRKLDGVSSPFFFSSRRRHTRCGRDWSSDVCSSDLQLFDLGVPLLGKLDLLLFLFEDEVATGRHVVILGNLTLLKLGRQPVHYLVELGILIDSARNDQRSEERRVGKECRCRGARYH